MMTDAIRPATPMRCSTPAKRTCAKSKETGILIQVPQEDEHDHSQRHAFEHLPAALPEREPTTDGHRQRQPGDEGEERLDEIVERHPLPTGVRQLPGKPDRRGPARRQREGVKKSLAAGNPKHVEAAQNIDRLHPLAGRRVPRVAASRPDGRGFRTSQPDLLKTYKVGMATNSGTSLGETLVASMRRRRRPAPTIPKNQFPQGAKAALGENEAFCLTVRESGQETATGPA